MNHAIADSRIPLGICFLPFLHCAERRILPTAAPERGVPKSRIIATGSTGTIGGHCSFIVHIERPSANCATTR
jgi:hypothetical protein